MSRRLPPALSLLWLAVKAGIFLALTLKSIDVVLVAYQQF